MTSLPPLSRNAALRLNLPAIFPGGPTFRPLPREAAPTVTFNTTSPITSPQTIYAVIPATNALNSQYFGFYGPKKIGMQFNANPRYYVATAAESSADTLGLSQFVVSFFTTAQNIDILKYGDGYGCDILVDDLYVGKCGTAIATGTAQAGAAGSITLAAGASGTTGFYNQCYVRLTGGTGSGQIRQITAYNASTKVATTDTNWTTAPDATSTYSIENSPIGFALDGLTGSVKFISLAFPAASPSNPVTRKITVIGSSFLGVNIGPNDAVWPGPPVGQMTLIAVGDSFWDGTSGPLAQPILMHQLAMRLGMQLCNLSSGSTGVWCTGSNNRLNFLNRIAPPAEAWEFTSPTLLGVTGGTFTISVTYNGTTQTTSSLAYNATDSQIQTALNALTFNGFNPANGVSWVGPTGTPCMLVARGDIGSNMILIANGMPGATISVSPVSTPITFTGALSGATSATLTANWTGPNITLPVTFSDSSVRAVSFFNNSTTATWTGAVTATASATVNAPVSITPYVGDLAKNIPTDANGNALPFVFMAGGSGNDPSAVSAITFTGALTAATSATLTANWTNPSGTYYITFSNGAQVPATFTNGSTAVSWSGAQTATASATVGFADALGQANWTSIAQALNAKFPTAIPIFVGVLTLSDGGGSGVIAQTDINHNAAIKAAAQLLPQINGQTPFIDTYSAGLGGNCWLTGSGTVGAPTSNKTDFMKGLIASGHPTGVGVGYYAARLDERVLGLLRGLADGTFG